STRPEFAQTLDETAADVKADIGLDEIIAAFYEDPKDPEKLVLLVGGTKLLLRPDAELDSAFEGFSSEGAQVAEITN
ncbi:hypothetical protein, partial [Halalkalicoccus sp. NIPERK01]|uniref:hypothetical protein n=1 Tax=Halalkalicoccus sp. NIPERK01 TaxID=3053469 RepID=UPI00256F5B6B